MLGEAFRSRPRSLPSVVDANRVSMQTIRKVLLVEDNPGDVRLLREMFNEEGSPDVDLACVSFMSEAEKYLATCTVDIILLDLGLPDAQGLAAIRRVRMAASDIPLVVLTGMDDEALAAQCLQEGAQDYLIKGQIETRGLLRVLRYATERKRLERLKDEFVSTVSHELRTPLTSITGSLGLLMAKASGTWSEPANRLLQMAHTNSQRLARLVNDILDTEKLGSGHTLFDFERVEVKSLLEQTVEAITGYAEGHSVKVRIEAAAPVDYIRADAGRLAQVVTNLLSNAIKFSPPGGEVVVAVENKREVDVVRITVRDRGSGISAGFKSRIFERFAQEDATNARRKGGTGLGLSIAKQIIVRLGGDIGFADAPGGGTIFHVELPIWDGLTDLASDKQMRNKLAPATSLIGFAEVTPGLTRAAISAREAV
jgi:signal transduction histidine kinase